MGPSRRFNVYLEAVVAKSEKMGFKKKNVITTKYIIIHIYGTCLQKAYKNLFPGPKNHSFSTASL